MDSNRSLSLEERSEQMSEIRGTVQFIASLISGGLDTHAAQTLGYTEDEGNLPQAQDYMPREPYEEPVDAR